MKKTCFLFVLLTLMLSICMTVQAKTHNSDVLATDTIEYTLGEDDTLSCELFIDEQGLYNIRVTSLLSSGFSPKIKIAVFQNSREIYCFETGKPETLDDSSQKVFEFIAGLAEGEYKLKITNLTKFSDVSFKIETVFTAQKNTETKNNNSFEKATPMDFSTKYFGGVSMAKESDFYSFEMPYDGYAFIRMYSKSIKFFVLYDQNKNEIGNIGIKIDGEDVTYELRSGLAKGKYYIRITPEESYTDPLYAIEVKKSIGNNFEKEYNNSNEFSTPIESGKEYQGNLFGEEDEDVFSFTLPEKSNITLDFYDTLITNYGHYNIRLTDGNSTIFHSDECGRESFSGQLDKGTYYFTVSSLGYRRFTNMAYKLKLTSDIPAKISSSLNDENSSLQKENNEETQSENITQFADVNENSWYAADLLEARKLNLVEGTSDNLYNPTGNVTLAEVITMAQRLYSKKHNVYPDSSLNGGKWYTQAVSFAIDKNIIKKEDFSSYEKNATRAEMAYIFSSLFDDIGHNTYFSIPDVDNRTQHHESIYKLYSHGILGGNDEHGTFYPEKHLSRAEAAVILLRIYNT